VQFGTNYHKKYSEQGQLWVLDSMSRLLSSGLSSLAAMCEAGGFSNVSKQAMIIRLQDLGLMINKTSTKMDWAALCANV